ncbi:MAG: acetate/propionate family kinase [Actinobacteria bacterium]|nr:acetate/propionate family kinase [Actinomycetota bacterium]
MIIGIGNIDSSSLGIKIININNRNETMVLGEALLDNIISKEDYIFFHRIGEADGVKEKVRVAGLDEGIGLILDWFKENGVVKNLKDIEAMGFKCTLVEKNGASIITPRILEEMEKFLFVAPLASRILIEAIGILKKIIEVPMVGVFEPSFHWTIPQFRKILGLPWEWHNKPGIKKNGYHSASHRYMSAMASKLMGSEKINIMAIHLGRSSSICAVKNGKSIDTSMSFSSNSGMLQGTGAGDTDGTALLFSMKNLGMSVDEAQNQISTNAGLSGIAGIGNDDMSEIISACEKGNKRAKMALDLYIDSVRKYIGAFSTVLGRLDCIVFGGENGEKIPYIRKKCLENMDYMGIRLDLARNKELNGQLGIISSDYSVMSRVKIYIVPVDEEKVVAFFTKKVIEKGRDLAPEEMIFKL